MVAKTPVCMSAGPRRHAPQVGETRAMIRTVPVSALNAARSVWACGPTAWWGRVWPGIPRRYTAAAPSPITATTEAAASHPNTATATVSTAAIHRVVRRVRLVLIRQACPIAVRRRYADQNPTARNTAEAASSHGRQGCSRAAASTPPAPRAVYATGADTAEGGQQRGGGRTEGADDGGHRGAGARGRGGLRHGGPPPGTTRLPPRRCGVGGLAWCRRAGTAGSRSGRCGAPDTLLGASRRLHGSTTVA